MMLENLILHYNEGNKSQFSKRLGISAQGLSTWLSRSTFDAELIYSKCEGLSADWLLSGEGPMLRGGEPSSGKAYVVKDDGSSYTKRIPLVHEKVAAGFGSSDFSISEEDVKEYYVIPKFKHCKVDFMIEVSGVSMMPHLNPGDVIACAILHDSKFLQWNHCHVIATREQGLLVKRLMQGSDPDHLLAVSDNKDYPPFEIPKEDITGIALVVGSVCLE